jgi:hypothetical protein
MATKKKPARGARPAGKKAAAAKAKRSPSQSKPKSKGTVKSSKPPLKIAAPRPRIMIVPPSEPLFRAAELDGAATKAKVPMPSPTKATPVRVPRPPAKLPIPHSTYFF